MKQFERIDFKPAVFYPRQPQSDFQKFFLSDYERAEGFLKARIEELAEIVQSESIHETVTRVPADLHKIFVVHGHDHGLKDTVARFIAKLGLTPVILHEQADRGRTIIEKFEDHSDVSCAVVVLSADDTGQSKHPEAEPEERARQNVIFEMGFFFGKLGRKRTFVLVPANVTRPSDTDGILYIPMDTAEAWQMSLLKEFKAAGLTIDANKAF